MLLPQHVNNDENAHMLESYYSIFLIWNACVTVCGPTAAHVTHIVGFVSLVVR